MARFEEVNIEPLKSEIIQLENKIDELSYEIQEYKDFLNYLNDYLIWDTGKRARGARVKIETFLKSMEV